MFGAHFFKKKNSHKETITGDTSVFTIIGKSGAMQIIDKINELNASGWDGKPRVISIDCESTINTTAPSPDVF